MNTITVVIHTRNEGVLLKEAIQSARLLTSNVIVIDMESEDQTTEVAKSMGTFVFTVPPQPYVELVRNFGIEKVKTPWFFILDPDERLTPALVSEIKKRILSPEYTSYKVPRKNIFAERGWLKHGGWWPDYQIRLIKKEAFKKWPTEIHSTPVISGKQGFLDNPLIHFFHGDFEKMVEKTLIFEEHESELLFKAGKPVSTPTFFRKFLGELYRRLVAKGGFLDGGIGIIEGVYQAFSKTITYLLLYEKNLKREHGKEPPAGRQGRPL